MIHTKEYKIHRDRISALLNEIDGFDSKMLKFIAKYPNYEYSVTIDSCDKIWHADVKITKHGKTNIT